MRKRLLDFIICPDCKAELSLEVFRQEDAEIKEGLLRCTACQSIYPIIGFIPRFIREALSEHPDFFKKYPYALKNNLMEKGSSSIPEPSLKTRKSFGYQWTRRMFSHMIPRFEKDFLNYVYPLEKSFFREKTGVDIGCGFGRHIYYAACFGAEMIGLDFSNAIDSAFRNTKGIENIHLIQADIYNLPLRNGVFDFVYSIGVLHHLPDPERGFRAILPLVKPQGHVAVWVYSKSRPFVNLVIETARLVTKRIPHKMLYLICIILSFVEWLIFIMPYKIMRRAPLIKNFAEKITLRRIKTYSEYPFDVLCADWFDRLAAPIRYYYNEEELRGWLKRADLKIIKITPTDGYGWRCLGQRV